jgi:hypothetical protein
MVLRDIMSPKKHPIAWLALVFIGIILLADWIVPQALRRKTGCRASSNLYLRTIYLACHPS